MKIHEFVVRALVLPSLFALTSGVAQANVKLPNIFGDHMVLQRDAEVPLWGWADPGEQVTVSAANQTALATAGQDGKWIAKLKKMAASDTPIEVTVAGKNTIVLKDVLIGDVWVCSGQSNMEFDLSRTSSVADEVPKVLDGQLRLFLVPKAIAPKPAQDIAAAQLRGEGSWQVCSPDTSVGERTWMGFSGIGYYFGKNIHAATGKPVGMIGSYWGGSPAQAWTSLEALKPVPALKIYTDEGVDSSAVLEKFLETRSTVAIPEWNAAMEKWDIDNKAAMETYVAASKQWVADAKQAVAENKPLPSTPKPVPPRVPRLDSGKNQGMPAGPFNAMIAPIIPYGIKGAIWYQGEANALNPVLYRTLFPTMITDWRARWGQGDFPFLFVQLANFTPGKSDAASDKWALLREAQAQTLALPNTGMAVTLDIGEAADIHPKDKWDVALRLALAARHIAYGEEIAFSGPLYKAMTTEAGQIRIQFDHAEGGLVICAPPEHFHPGEPRAAASELLGFTIAGADLKFVPAKAKIDGDKVVVSSEAVPSPVAVRYAWADSPIANLYNKQGLPAAPFRTDTDSPQ